VGQIQTERTLKEELWKTVLDIQGMMKKKRYFKKSSETLIGNGQTLNKVGRVQLNAVILKSSS